MLDLVSETDQKFKILLLRGVLVNEVLPETLSQIPVLRVTVDLDVSDSLGRG